MTETLRRLWARWRPLTKAEIVQMRTFNAHAGLTKLGRENPPFPRIAELGDG